MAHLKNGRIVNDEEELNWRKSSADFESIAIRESFDSSQFQSKCIVPPIVTSSIYMMESATGTSVNRREDGSKIYEYSRWGNPTRDILDNLIAALDGARYCLTFGSGTAAITAVAYILESGDHLISTSAVYGGSYALYKELSKFGVAADFVIKHENVQEFVKLVKPNTKMICLETPANPTMTLVDIEKLVKTIRIDLNRKDIIIVVDNTLLTPIFQRPLELGADVVMYACSKYLGGHADVIMGAVTVHSHEIYEKIRKSQLRMGGIPSAIDCYLMIRSLKTLPIRMKQHSKNGMKVAKFLEKHPQVEKVIFSGLKSHPQHKLALSQQFGVSGMVGFYIKGGFKAAEIFLGSIKVFQRAPSLGCDISLASIPGRMSHSKMPTELKQQLGISDNFIRLSVGLENAQIQINDLDQALFQAATGNLKLED